jgi:hypothetical protein
MLGGIAPGCVLPAGGLSCGGAATVGGAVTPGGSCCGGAATVGGAVTPGGSCSGGAATVGGAVTPGGSCCGGAATPGGDLLGGRTLGGSMTPGGSCGGACAGGGMVRGGGLGKVGSKVITVAGPGGSGPRLKLGGASGGGPVVSTQSVHSRLDTHHAPSLVSLLHHALMQATDIRRPPHLLGGYEPGQHKEWNPPARLRMAPPGSAEGTAEG